VEALHAFGRDLDGNKRAMRLRLLVVRAVLGGLFVGHGAQKLLAGLVVTVPKGRGSSSRASASVRVGAARSQRA
jgi:uncharacterized membrane protein YphA (DoxX/SURF4 family)